MPPKPVNSGNQTPVDKDADVILMNELGLLGGEEQSSFKTTGKVLYLTISRVSLNQIVLYTYKSYNVISTGD
jgi:hypothetical protein